MALAASTFTRDEAVDFVKGELGLRSSNLLLAADLTQWGVEANSIIARETLWAKTSAYVNAVASTKEYDLPTNCIAIEEVLHSTSGTAGTHLPLQQVTLADLYSRDPYWRQEATGTPLLYYVRGASVYGLHPTPGTNVTNGIQVIYAYIPTPPASGSATYSVPYGNGQAILCYMKWRASLKDISGEGRLRVELYQREWLQALQELKESVVDLDEAGSCVMGADSSPYGRSRVWGWVDSPADAAP